MKGHFKIRIQDATPETFDVRELLPLVAAFEAMVRSYIDDLTLAARFVLSLVGVEEGSVQPVFKCNEPETATKAAMEAVSVIERRQFRGTPSEKAAASYAKQARRSGKIIQLFPDLQNHPDLSLTITPDFSRETRPSRYKEITHIYGKVVRIGGEKNFRAQIRLDDGRLFSRCTMSEEICRNLGKRWNQVVELEGEATWELQDPPVLVAFNVSGIGPFVETPISDIFKGFDAIAEAWKDVPDVTAEIMRMRYGEENNP